jgi:acyl carrier protein
MMKNMTLEKFIELFADELDETELESIGPATEFKELGEWDSLAALGIIAMIDEEFEVVITGSDILKSRTIKDLFLLIQERL